MGVGDLDVVAPCTPAGFSDRAVRATPPDQQKFGVSSRIVDFQIGNGDAVDLGLTQPHHEVVIGRLVGDVAATRSPTPTRRCGARDPECPERRRAELAFPGRDAYGWKGLSGLAKVCWMGSSASTSGIGHGSDPLAIARRTTRSPGCGTTPRCAPPRGGLEAVGR